MDSYSVFVEDALNAVTSGIDETRIAVVESADRNEQPYLTDTDYEHLYIAVDSEGRIAYLVFAPSAGHGTAYADSYYRNSYYAYGTRDEGELPDHEFGTGRVNPALVVDKESELSWGFYSKWQIVVPENGFVVVAKGDTANEFLYQIFGKTFDLSTKDSREITATEINRSVELHANASDDITLTLNRETLEITVNTGTATIITPNVINENIGDGHMAMAIYTDYEIDGKLPQTSEYDSTKYTFNHQWSTVIAVSDEGKVLVLGFSHWLGYGGAYNGPDVTFNGFNQYPGLLNKDNPAFAVSENWKPWAEDAAASQLWNFVVPEGGFLIGIKGAAKTGQILALLMDDPTLEAKIAEGGDRYNYSTLKADYPDGIPETIRLYLTWDNKLLIENEKNVKATPTIVNPQEQTSSFAVWSDTWVNGTIAPYSSNTWGNVPEGRRTFMTPVDSNNNAVPAFTFAVDAQGKLRYAFSGCSNLTIYCEATSQPSGWDYDWNDSNRPVVWGYNSEN